MPTPHLCHLRENERIRKSRFLSFQIRDKILGDFGDDFDDNEQPQQSQANMVMDQSRDATRRMLSIMQEQG